MQAKLVVSAGKAGKRVVALKLPTVIGRSRQADLTIVHPMISRRHCELSEQDGVIMLRDLGSLNGTTLGGRRVALAPLLPDSRFNIGSVVFQVHYEFTGDLDQIPETEFADETAQPSEAEEAGAWASDDVPDFEETLDDEPIGAEASDKPSNLPDIEALADMEDVEDFMQALEEPQTVPQPKPSVAARHEPIPPRATTPKSPASPPKWPEPEVPDGEWPDSAVVDRQAWEAARSKTAPSETPVAPKAAAHQPPKDPEPKPAVEAKALETKAPEIAEAEIVAEEPPMAAAAPKAPEPVLDAVPPEAEVVAEAEVILEPEPIPEPEVIDEPEIIAEAEVVSEIEEVVEAEAIVEAEVVEEEAPEAPVRKAPAAQPAPSPADPSPPQALPRTPSPVRGNAPSKSPVPKVPSQESRPADESKDIDSFLDGLF